jgi:hypothetical protein
MAPGAGGSPPPEGAGPFDRFDLPDDWEERFWSSPDVKALLRLSPKQVADLVPVQAGIRFCRCPACEADEADDPLAWSAEHPEALTCRRCGVTVPNDKFPAHEDKKPAPEEKIEVRPGVVHSYPYHEVPADHQRYPEERLYLAAKRDYEAKTFLCKAALYAAVRYHEQPPGRKDSALARLACVVLVRFAQVYPLYATHYDQPASPKFFTPADLAPPYRPGYKTGKWDWSGSLDVPLNLVTAYAQVRHDPALGEVGRELGVSDPARLIERDLFRASAEFVRQQPEEYGEAALQADRGILAVGRLLNDQALVRDARERLARFAERGFYHDGFWRQGTLAAHRRVLGQLDGWFDRLLAGTDIAGPLPGPGASAGVPMLALARAAGSAVLTDPEPAETLRASWPAPPQRTARPVPMLLGGAGLARLSVGSGGDALDLELRSLDAFGPERLQRQALRVGVGGRPALDDLDEHPGLSTGFDRASASRNTVVVDGLNQRESLETAREAAPGGNFLFFAADPDFQVVTLDDPRAYPRSTTRYRQTLVATSGARARWAVGVFEVHGGLQHDQVFHGPAGGGRGVWQLSAPAGPAPATLLPPGLTYLPNARAGDDRWFVQSFGAFAMRDAARLIRPSQALWTDRGAGVRLHLLGDTPVTALTATTPDPSSAATAAPRSGDDGRASLVLRRRSANGSTLRSVFVTVFEPVSGATPPLTRVGRVVSSDGTVVVYAETADGPEHLVVNLDPGAPRTVTLADGRPLTTDGLAVRVTSGGLVLAGGTFAEVSGRRVDQVPAAGKVVRAVRKPSADGQSRGWFQSDAPLPDTDTLAGRVVLVRHGDGTTRGWTLTRVENAPGGARLFVREEPGFALDPATGQAQYYQFPRARPPGPHPFRVDQIARDHPAPR